MPPAYEVLLLNTAVPQIQAAQAGDTYVVPRDIAVNANMTVTGNVGIGTSLPTTKLDVVGSGDGDIRIRAGSDAALIFSETTANKNWKLKPSAGDFYWQYSGTAYNSGYSAQMVLTSSGNLGIGTNNPAYKLDVQTTATGTAAGDNTVGFFGSQASGRDVNIRFGDSVNASARIGYLSGALYMYTNGAERLRLNLSGNLGLGVTPSAWGSTWTALQVGRTVMHTASDGRASFGGNYYVDGTDARYIASAAATQLMQVSGEFRFFNAASGTAGNAISFTQAMTLDASGRLGIGQTSPAYTLDVTGSTSTARLGKLTITNDSPFVTGANIDAGANSFALGTSGAGIVAFFSNNTERARITSGGYFKASNDGTYPKSASGVHEFSSTAADLTMQISNENASNDPYGVDVVYTASTPNGTGNRFLGCYDNNGGNLRAAIRSNGGLANYQSNNVDLSDIRTKTDINPVASYWNKIAALEIVSYKYRDQTHDDLNIGVIAQQVEQVAPEFVDTDGFGDTPEDGVPLKTIYNKDLTFAAIKALQEAMARIETLEAEVAALKGN